MFHKHKRLTVNGQLIEVFVIKNPILSAISQGINPQNQMIFEGFLLMDVPQNLT